MMRRAATVLILVLLNGGLMAAQAQTQSHPATTEKPKSRPVKPPVDDNPGMDTPATAEGKGAKKPGVEANPFPEEQSKSAAEKVETGQAPAPSPDVDGDVPSNDPASKGKEAAPSNGGVSSSRTQLEGLDDYDPDASRKLKTSIAEPVQNPKLSSEDVAIGKMYLQSENYRGAYVRYKEALSLNPENADAAFGVAETARKLNLTDEAMHNYQLCVDLDPGGPRAKAARKALTALSSRTSH